MIIKPNAEPVQDTGGEAGLTDFQAACIRILGAEPSRYIPMAAQEHERTKQIYRARRKYNGSHTL